MFVLESARHKSMKSLSFEFFNGYKEQLKSRLIDAIDEMSVDYSDRQWKEAVTPNKMRDAWRVLDSTKKLDEAIGAANEICRLISTLKEITRKQYFFNLYHDENSLFYLSYQERAY